MWLFISALTLNPFNTSSADEVKLPRPVAIDAEMITTLAENEVGDSNIPKLRFRV